MNKIWNTPLTKEDIEKGNKYLKRNSISYIFRAMKILKMRYYHIPIKMTKIQNTDSTMYW